MLLTLVSTSSDWILVVALHLNVHNALQQSKDAKTKNHVTGNNLLSQVKFLFFFFFLVALRVILNHYPALHFLTSSCLTVSLVCHKLSFPDSKHFITLLSHLQTFTLVASPASILSPYSQIPLILWTLLKHRLKFESK